MVKINTPQEELGEKLGNLIGILLCGSFTGIIIGVLGLGVGLMFLNTIPALGLGLIFSVVGFGYGVRKSVHQVLAMQTKQDRSPPVGPFSAN